VLNLKAAKALGLDVPPSLPRARRRGDRYEEARVHHDCSVGAGSVADCGRAHSNQRERISAHWRMLMSIENDPTEGRPTTHPDIIQGLAGKLVGSTVATCGWKFRWAYAATRNRILDLRDEDVGSPTVSSNDNEGQR